MEKGILDDLTFEDLGLASQNDAAVEKNFQKHGIENCELEEVKLISRSSKFTDDECRPCNYQCQVYETCDEIEEKVRKSAGLELKNDTFLIYEKYSNWLRDEHILEQMINQYKAYADKETALSVIQPLIAIIKGNEYMLTVVLADLLRRKVFKELDFKTHSEAMATLFSLKRKTCDAYTDIGLTYFTIDGKPIAEYVTKLCIGHLVSLKAMIKGHYCIYGNKIDHVFIDAIVNALPTIPKLQNWRKLLSALKEGNIPPALVDYNNNGNWVVTGSNIVLWGYEKPDEVLGENKAHTEVNLSNPLADLAKDLEIIGKHNMSEEQAKEFKSAVERLTQIVNDIYGNYT